MASWEQQEITVFGQKAGFMITAQALDEFLNHRPALDRLRQQLIDRLGQALERAGIKVHSLSSRLKEPESLRHKLMRPDKTYHCLWDVTDLMGLRATTYFEDNIGAVAAVIENCFEVDFRHTQDRLAHRDVSSFGYRSLHYVCAPNGEELLGLPAKFRFEIQVRTILQHAWAEIEHDLGYKASDTTPEAIRRRFTRIAGLLELVDEEFVSIRRELERYEASLGSDPGEFALDRLSLNSLVHSSALGEVDEEVARVLQRPLSEELFFPEYLLKMLRLAGFRKARPVLQALEQYRSSLVSMVQPYFEFTREAWKLSSTDLESVPRGYCLFFLCHCVILDSAILEHNKVAKLAHFYRELDYPEDEEAAMGVAAGLVEHLGVR